MSRLYIGGEWVASSDGQTSDVVNPFDQSVLAKVDDATPADVARAISAARHAFDTGDWPRTPAAERGALLVRVADLLTRDREELARTETLDTGKTLTESRIDVDDVIRVFRYYAELADTGPGREVDTGGLPAVSRVVYEPVGVCALITPWNYPLLQASWKIAPALAAGNTVVVKPSELTPLSTIRLVGLLAEAGAPLGNGLLPGTESGPLISAAHRDKIEGYVALGHAEGARLLAGGARPAEPELAAGFFYRPTVFADCHRGMSLVQRETFGPIVTAERFGTEAEAVALGNDTVFGLAGAVWTQDIDKAKRVAGRLRHGTIWINDYHPYLPQAEWGGFKQSGIGRELGSSGLHEYLEAKHIWHNLDPKPQRWFAA